MLNLKTIFEEIDELENEALEELRHIQDIYNDLDDKPEEVRAWKHTLKNHIQHLQRQVERIQNVRARTRLSDMVVARSEGGQC